MVVCSVENEGVEEGKKGKKKYIYGGGGGFYPDHPPSLIH